MNTADHGLVAEFEWSIQPVIPRIVSLLGDNYAGDALVKLSKQSKISNVVVWMLLMSFIAEFEESIWVAIPQIITLLGNS